MIPVCTLTNDEEIAVPIVGGYITGKRYGNGDVMTPEDELEVVDAVE